MKKRTKLMLKDRAYLDKNGAWFPGQNLFLMSPLSSIVDRALSKDDQWLLFHILYQDLSIVGIINSINLE